MKHVNIVESIFAAAALLSAAGARADTWTDPSTGYTWSYRISNGGAEICDHNGASSVSPSPSGAVTIPSVLGGYSVIGIGYYAFSGYNIKRFRTIFSFAWRFENNY